MGAFLKANDDVVLTFINSNLVTLRGNEKKIYMKYFTDVLESVLEHMKQEDKLFEAIYQRVFFAGSYYDGLKIGKPDEYDIDIVVKLPIDYELINIDNKATPPFIRVNALALKQLKSHPRYEEYKAMESWVDGNGFLLQDKFRAWMDSIVDKGLNSMPRATPASFYKISRKRSGPAVTLHVDVGSNTDTPIELDIDLVPVIEFSKPKWPPAPTRKNPFPDKDSWFVVPKPNSKELSEFQGTFWRFAFHDQEKQMIEDKMLLKPVIRLLKQLRDTEELGIASYFIKTMFMWEIQQRSSSYWAETRIGTLFMDMLRRLRDYVKKGNLPNFWDPRANLLDSINPDELRNIGGRLDNIVNNIESRVDEYPNIFAKYLLTPEQLQIFLSFDKPGN